MWGYKKIISLFKFHFPQRVTNNLSEEEMIVLLPAAGNLFIYLRRDFMIPETSVDWKAFEYKYSNNPQRAFFVILISPT